MNLEYIKKHSDWVKMWSGKCSINSDTQMGEMWTSKKILISGKPIYSSPIIFIIRKGVTDCWARQKDRDELGKRLVSEIRSNPKKIKQLAESLKSNARDLFSFVKKYENKKINLNIYNEFWSILTKYYFPHLSVKYTADYLSLSELKKYLKILEEARIFAEPVFREQEKFIEKNTNLIAPSIGLTKEQFLSLSKDEWKMYFKNSIKIPKASVLDKKYKNSVLIFKNGKFDYFSGISIVEKIEKILIPKNDLVRGVVAYKGKVSGIARIVLHPKNYTGAFEKSDILITGMTRPEFLPYLKKAAAFVTDSGGTLSHAAISAREMKKPCIVGTASGTKVFRDGDLVEVDANKGIIKILKKLKRKYYAKNINYRK